MRHNNGQKTRKKMLLKKSQQRRAQGEKSKGVHRVRGGGVKSQKGKGNRERDEYGTGGEPGKQEEESKNWEGARLDWT